MSKLIVDTLQDSTGDSQAALAGMAKVLAKYDNDAILDHSLNVSSLVNTLAGSNVVNLINSFATSHYEIGESGEDSCVW